MHLIFTGVTRNAEDVCKDVTANIDKIRPLLDTADEAFDILIEKDYDKFLHLLHVIKTCSHQVTTSGKYL